MEKAALSSFRKGLWIGGGLFVMVCAGCALGWLVGSVWLAQPVRGPGPGVRTVLAPLPPPARPPVMPQPPIPAAPHALTLAQPIRPALPAPAHHETAPAVIFPPSAPPPSVSFSKPQPMRRTAVLPSLPHVAARPVGPILTLRPQTSRRQPDGGWLVQLGAFRDPANAQSLVARLTADGFHVVAVRHGVLTFVYTPVLAARAQAVAMAAAIHAKDGVPSYIVQARPHPLADPANAP